MAARQRSPEDDQQLRAWYKVRDTLFGENYIDQDKKALELASVCEHPNAVWLTKIFAGRELASPSEASQVFLDSENDPRALSFGGFLGGGCDVKRRAAELGDALAQAVMASAWQTGCKESFRWAEKSVAQGERDGFFWLGHCHRGGIGCEKDAERAKENYLVAAELGHVYSMVSVASYLTNAILNDLFGLEELLLQELLRPS
jgi:hypothetical protein